MREVMDMVPKETFALQPSAALVALAELLALPSAALEERIERELAENPALERRDVPVCLACGERSPDGECSLCVPTVTPSRRPGPAPLTGDGDVDVLRLVPWRPSDAERLLAEVRPLLEPQEQAIAAYLAGSLDGLGKLECDPGEVAAACGVDVTRVTRVLQVMQHAGPAGVAARDARECLLLQLDRWEEEHRPEPLVRRVLEAHLEPLAHGRLRMIAAAIGVSKTDVMDARGFIRTHLRPYPPAGLEPTDRLACLRDIPWAVPDVAIVKRPEQAGGFAVQLLEPGRMCLLVDPLYRELAEGRGGAATDRSHARRHVRRATFFLARLQERWRTIGTVAEHVVRRQAEFLRNGPRFLVPISRAEVAAALGLHESTVSRAVAGKYARLPSGRVMAFADFFDASLGPLDVLRRVLAVERRPLSDAELARALTDHGFPVARRMAAKYRAKLGVPARAVR
jgi:RNA polymerase sigma-54 factor